MADISSLFEIFKKIDGKPYSKFKDIQGTYSTEWYTIHIDSVQGSQFAEPSAIRVSTSLRNAGFPDELMAGVRRTALADAVARRFWESSRSNAKEISFQRPSQEILERGCVTIAPNHIEASFAISLPAAGKNAAGRDATDLFRRLDTIVSESLRYTSYRSSKLQKHVETYENAEHIRSVLDGMGLVSFIANGSTLPRREDGLAPMIDASPFVYSGTDAVSIDLPNGEAAEGLGIRKGFTAIMGTTGSGRSVIADAVMAGVHDHIPGDGRELVVTVSDSVFISKQRRPVNNVDMNTFFLGECDDVLTGPAAEAAAMADAVEAGATLMIMDEDSSSNAVMFRDVAVRELLPEREQVVPVTDLAASAYEQGVSFIIVSNSGSVISSCDDILITNGGTVSRTAGGRVSKGSFNMPEPRYPMVGKELRPYDDADGRNGSNDRVYRESVKHAVIAMTEMMDGSSSIRSISQQQVNLTPRTVRVRPIDIAMTIARSEGLSMIRKRN